MTDYSPDAIAGRLRQVSDARRLGISLGRAGIQIRDESVNMSGPQTVSAPDVSSLRSVRTNKRANSPSAAEGARPDEHMESIAPHVSSESSRRWLHGALGLHDGDTPFPWQEDLLARFMRGLVERSVDIPTGLGKTGVMAIWLVARALGAFLPRRLVYVVDRRAVVDQATDVARELQSYLGREQEVRRALGLGERPLPISTLRGQHVDNKEWLESPASPAIIVGTVDMIGSRLLFEGYATSRKMRPYHAGLLGADTLVVLDEAHLVPPFERLIETVADGEALFGASDHLLRKLVPPFKLLSLSATGRAGAGKSIGLQPADLEHPVVRRRLEAKKRLTLLPLEEATTLVDAIAEHAWKLSDCGARAVRCLVFCNKREVATATKKAIEKLAKGEKEAGRLTIEIDTELFVGGRRVFEREAAAKRLKELGFIAGARIKRTRPAFLLATSAGEVGVDLDADHMVADLVAWERMVQRLGRVNRRGEGDARVIVIREPEPKPKKPVQDAMDKKPSGRNEKESRTVAAFDASLRWARALGKPIGELPLEDGYRDASPGAIRELKLRAEANSVLQDVIDSATTPAPLRPALTRALVDAWSMTSLREHAGRPEIDPWLRGWIEDDEVQTSVVWRTHLPVRTLGSTVTKKEVESFFDAAPPHTSETLDAETYRVLEWLCDRGKALVSRSRQQAPAEQHEGMDGGVPESAPIRTDEVVGFVLTSANDLREVLHLADFATIDEDQDISKRQREDLRRQLKGATLVLDARVAGLHEGLLDSNAECLPRTADDGEEWISTGGPAGDASNPFAPVVRFRVRPATSGASVDIDIRWRERLRFATEVTEDGDPVSWLIIEKWRADPEDPAVGRPQLLDEHQAWAEDRARQLARRLGLPGEYADMLGIAAGLHDQGKQAKRWQRAFNAKSDGVYAKTIGPVNSALLDGYRHEFGSLPFAAADARFQKLPEDLRELALHLIASHHGFARPIIGTTGCEDAPPSVLEERAGDVSLRFARLQRRWGPWGLAWWEALSRAADQQASRDNDVSSSTPAKRER